MSVQDPSPGPGELHPIAVSMVGDFTDSECAVCGPLGRDRAVAYGADHTLATGHTVTSRHVTVSTIRELRVKEIDLPGESL